MYNNVVSSLPAAAIPTAASLPFTGLNVLWLLLAAFTLLAAAGALYRMAPRKQG